MYTRINSQEAFNIVTLNDAKTQCSLVESFTLDDEYIEHLIDVACDMAQSYTKLLLSPGSVTIEQELYSKQVQLPYGNATTVTEVLVDGVATTSYTFSEISQKVTLGDGVTFSNIKVTYNCGYAVNTVPTKVKHGILMMISTFYRNRDDFTTGFDVAQMPMRSQTLLNSVKRYAA